MCARARDQPEQNSVTSFIQALFTRGDLGAVDESLAEEYVDHDPPWAVRVPAKACARREP